MFVLFLCENPVPRHTLPGQRMTGSMTLFYNIPSVIIRNIYLHQASRSDTSHTYVV